MKLRTVIIADWQLYWSSLFRLLPAKREHMHYFVCSMGATSA